MAIWKKKSFLKTNIDKIQFFAAVEQFSELSKHLNFFSFLSFKFLYVSSSCRENIAEEQERERKKFIK
jgi:hypothetical protein